MKSLSIKTRFTSLAAAAMIIASAFFGAGCETLVSDQQEISMGQQYSQQLAQEKTIRHAPYLSSLGHELSQFAPARPGINYQFSVVEDEELNAFAIPGGHIYVHSGTIKAVDSASELAGVMAHEISHVALLHHRKTMGTATGIDLLNQLALEKQGQAVQTGAQLLEAGVMNKFSRTQEYEADDIAIDIMYRAGYNPMGLIVFFEKLTAKYGAGNKWLEFMSSHPITQDRITRARQRIQSLPPNPSLRDDTAAFQSFRRSL